MRAAQLLRADYGTIQSRVKPITAEQIAAANAIVALGGVYVPPTYCYACTYQPPHVRLTRTYLRRGSGFIVDDEVLNGHYQRYCGDAGEILVLAGKRSVAGEQRLPAIRK